MAKKALFARSAEVMLRRKIHRRFYRRMYWWRAGCIASLLVLLSLVRMGPDSIVSRSGMLPGLDDCRRTAYGRLWYCEAGGERDRLTEPLDPRQQAIWTRVMALAREHGFTFRDPAPVRTNAEADMAEPPEYGKVYAETWASGRIMVSSRDTKDMDDAELAILFGHELGHQIDLQNERRGHRVLNRLANMDHESIAWGIAADLYGGEAVEAFRDKWQHRTLLDLLD